MNSRLSYSRFVKMAEPLTRIFRRKHAADKESSGFDFKRLLRIAPREVLGLDVGSSAVKIVQLRKKDNSFTVTAAGIVQIDRTEKTPPDDAEDANTVTAITQCLESTQIQSRFAVCGVCGPEVAVRYFNFPALLVAEVEGAVLLEASQVCPFNVDDGAVDYQLIPDGDGSMQGVFVAATNKLIEEKSRLAQSASLETVLMDVDGLALLNCLAQYHHGQGGKTAAVLNVGSTCTNLAIVGENGLPFIRDIAYAGDDIVNEISSETGSPPDTVRKTLAGTDDSNQNKLQIDDSLARACQKLISDVNKTLRYYTAQEKSAAVDQIFVCGGFALVKGFVQTLESRLDAKVLLWNPFDKIKCDADNDCRKMLQKTGPALAVAAGLAMRSI
jgi:type IV pilus assembly protein PilM